MELVERAHDGARGGCTLRATHQELAVLEVSFSSKGHCLLGSVARNCLLQNATAMALAAYCKGFEMG